MYAISTKLFGVYFKMLPHSLCINIQQCE